MKITKVKTASLARVLGAMYALLGFIFGAFLTIASLLSGGAKGSILGIGAIVLFPLLYGAIGFVGGALSAALYNFIAKKVGGIEIETE
jgi:hypothetical protein